MLEDAFQLVREVSFDSRLGRRLPGCFFVEDWIRRVKRGGVEGVGSVGTELVTLLRGCKLSQQDSTGIKTADEDERRQQIYRHLVGLLSLALFGEPDPHLSRQSAIWHSKLADCPRTVREAKRAEHFLGPRKKASLFLGPYPRLVLGKEAGGSREALHVSLSRLGAWLVDPRGAKKVSSALHHPLCRQSSCLNLACLRWGTHSENLADVGKQRLAAVSPEHAHLRKRPKRWVPAPAWAWPGHKPAC